MTWRKLLAIASWVLFLTLILKFWLTSTHFSPIPAATTQFNLSEKKFNGPNIVIEDYHIDILDPYRFEVHYTVANRGDQAVKNLRIHILPWRAEGNMDDPADPRPAQPGESHYSEGKTDFLEQVNAKERIKRVQYFSHDSFKQPSGRQPLDTFDLHFELVQ